jgi:hypothetical protein
VRAEPLPAYGILAERVEAMLRDSTRGALALTLLTLVVYGAVVVAADMIGRPVQSQQAHFAWLADAFLNGRLDVDSQAAPQLVELVPHEGKHYVVYPPMPAVVLMPFVAMFGPELPTTLISIVVAALAVGATFAMLRRLELEWKVAATVAVVLAFGSGFWFTALKGSSWHFATVVSMLFLTSALIEAFGERQRPLLIGVLLGMAVLSRLPTALTLPFFLWLVVRDHPDYVEKIRRAAPLLAGVAIFVAANMLYNYGRYGTIFDVGYVRIPGVLDEPWYAQGILHWSYLPRNVYVFLFQPPLLIEEFPFFVPSTFGLSMFIATPAFFLGFLAPARQRFTWIVAATLLLAMLPGLTHGWPGGTQFGYRFAFDGGPFLLILTALGMRGRVTPRAGLLVALSIASALWGLAFARNLEPEWIFPLSDIFPG